MGLDALILLASIGCSGLAVTTHLALLIRAVRASSSPWWLRTLSLPLPPLAPVLAFRAGARGLVYLWVAAWLLTLLLVTRLG